MNVLFVPSIGLDLRLLERLAASVDYPIKYKVVLNNGNLGALDSFRDSHPDWIVKDAGINRGVAGSWNYCAERFPAELSWLIMNEDAWFLPGYLEKICQCADANFNAPMVHLNSSNAYYCFVWTAAGRKEFGEFDINLWPAYYEDCDMRVRHRLKGVTSYPYAIEGLLPLPHGKPDSGGVNYNALIQGCGLLNRSYWLKKWGSFDFENATYQNPYRDSRVGINEFVWYPEHRAELWPLFRVFMELPNPSIYE
jgi:GT2 family glycosyltransferase